MKLQDFPSVFGVFQIIDASDSHPDGGTGKPLWNATVPANWVERFKLVEEVLNRGWGKTPNDFGVPVNLLSDERVATEEIQGTIAVPGNEDDVVCIKAMGFSDETARTVREATNEFFEGEELQCLRKTAPTKRRSSTKPRKVEWLVVLDTMWGNAGDAPRFFKINPENVTGKRLIKLLGHTNFLVTNVCREQVAYANQHGKPDSKWLQENLAKGSYTKLLICGKTARECFESLESRPDCETVFISHPADRRWTKAKIEETKNLLQN